MIQNRLLKLGLAVVLAAVLVGGAAVVIQQTFFRPKSITAYFTTATAIYPGDEVRIAGVKVRVKCDPESTFWRWASYAAKKNSRSRPLV